MNPVAIIGGGITGLTAAYRLTRNHVPVMVYEAGGRVGGPMQSIREEGYLSEFGPNTILETSPKIGALIDDLGLKERRWESNPAMNRNYIVRGGRMRALPQSPVSFAFSPLLSAAAKVRIAREFFLRNQAEDEDESLADFVRRRFGQEFLDYAINPFVTGVYAGTSEELSVQYAFPKLKALEKKYGSVIRGAILGARERRKSGEVPRTQAKKISFDEGLQVLVDALETELREAVRLDTGVTGLRCEEGEWVVTSRSRTGEETHRHSAVLLTAPAHKIAEMKMEGVDFSILGEMAHPPVARVALGFRREDVADPLRGFGFLVPKAEGMKILGTTFSSSIFANRAPEGHVLLTTFVGGCRQPELALEPEEKLMELVVEDLRRVLGVRGVPTYRHCWLFRRAIPQYNVGHKKFVDFMNGMEKRFAGLYFAGSFRDGISAGNCIVSGHDVAGRIAQFLAVGTPDHLSQTVTS
ncbi:MAG: protoporphyrinogen oxidase [Methylacidiphilales bacterium]|nr:protoporphyrinogen oxidase [Candidatus Methylacidiphilales bacterium]